MCLVDELDDDDDDIIKLSYCSWTRWYNAVVEDLQAEMKEGQSVPACFQLLSQDNASLDWKICEQIVVLLETIELDQRTMNDIGTDDWCTKTVLAGLRRAVGERTNIWMG